MRIPRSQYQFLAARVPKPFNDAVREVADRRLTTTSSLVRQLLADVLREEGFNVAALRDNGQEEPAR